MRKYFTMMGLLAIIEIALALYLTFWREAFWQSVTEKNSDIFFTQIAVFTAIALLLCVISASASYMGRLAAIKWREILNTKALLIQESRIENFHQRVQDDCFSYPDLTINIGFNLLKSCVYLLVFSIALCMQFSYIYLILIMSYAIINTLVAKKIATPLIHLQYEVQRAEATYRGNLSTSNFDDCIRLMLGVAKRTKKLEYFQVFYGQIGVLVPICLIAPSYFAGVVTFGALMQAQSIMGTVLENNSFFVNNFSAINKLLSCRRRLKEIDVI